MLAHVHTALNMHYITRHHIFTKHITRHHSIPGSWILHVFEKVSNTVHWLSGSWLSGPESPAGEGFPFSCPGVWG